MANFAGNAATHIYCIGEHGRPPKPTDVRGFSLAAEAEAAGYRACPICRPYRSEPLVNWTDPEMVCRAVRLILVGALDGETEMDLGRRLGISARHLRRLFGDHLGLTPSQLARSFRAHFARRLLDDTDFTAAEIAFAAGFGSIRQFNRVCLDVFRQTPVELRSRRQVTDRLVADDGLVLRIPYQPPLDWPGMLAYMQDRAIAGVESVAGNTYRRTVEINGEPGLIELSLGGGDYLLLRVHLQRWEGLIHIVQRVRRIFNLDSDFQLADQQLAGDPLIGALVRRRRGLRPPGTWDPYETGVRIMVGQQVSVNGASTLAARIVQRYGVPLSGFNPFGLTHLFPSPQALARADLSGIGLAAARAEAVTAFARAIARDTVRLDGSLSLSDLADSLSGIPGLGPWTAQCVALRSGEPDAFPSTDLGLRRSLSHALGRSVTTRDADKLAQRWRPWRAHAAMHLWLADHSMNEEAVDDRTARSA